MNLIFFAVILLSIFHHFMCQQCPAIYLRYSKEHSYCKPRNPACPIYHAGVTTSEQRQIVNLHNKYRSAVATGKEKRAGGMPTAADMMQMVWDYELAAVAQKRVEQCIYAHDCADCRKVENFDVGQNIAYLDKQCVGAGQCSLQLNSVPDWSYVIKMFFDEVALFDKKYVNSLVFVPGKEYGHFTQMIWAKTWRIGCGFVAFKKERGYRQLYVCNYGPSGNYVNTPVYKVGIPCSSCPVNSCCGTSCKRINYGGLCHMNNINEAPIYRKEVNYLFYCDFSDTKGDCTASVNGANKWKSINAIGGSFVDIVLSGGETSTISFTNTIRPKQYFCVVLKYRSGPTIDGLKSASKAAVTFEMPNARPVIMNLPSVSSKQFFQYSIDLSWTYDTKISVTFSVPNGASEQFLDIQEISSKIGKCQ